MRIDVLHRRIAPDVIAIHEAVRDVLPASLPDKWIDHPCRIRQFVEALSIRSVYERVYVTYEDSVRNDPDGIGNSACWFHEKDQELGCDIKMVFHLHPKTRLFHWTPSVWKKRRFYFYQHVMHELVHRHQPEGEAKKYRPTGVSQETRDLQKYLGGYDEIEAYAHDAALEFVTQFPDSTYRQATTQALEYLTTSWAYYHHTFPPGHSALDTYRRKVRSWYDLMQDTDFYNQFELAKVLR